MPLEVHEQFKVLWKLVKSLKTQPLVKMLLITGVPKKKTKVHEFKRTFVFGVLEL